MAGNHHRDQGIHGPALVAQGALTWATPAMVAWKHDLKQSPNPAEV
jgi:hypothetical protein